MNDKQVKLYSVDTKAFYTTGKAPNKKGEGYVASEKALADVKIWAKSKMNKTDKYIKKMKKNNARLKDSNEKKLSEEELKKRIKRAKRNYDYLKGICIVANDRFTALFNKFKGIRKLNPHYLNLKNEVALFDSALTRAMGFKEDETTTDIIILRPYHYPILKQLMDNGYEFKGEKFQFLTASAGQMRGKRCVFVNTESWIKTQKKLMCGLTMEDMNNSEQHGFNLNKLLAYLALNNSSTDEWIEGFDIDKCIVIKDFENNVTGEVDYIDVDHKVKEQICRNLTKEEREEVNKKVKIYGEGLSKKLLVELRATKDTKVKEEREKLKVELKYDETRDKYKAENDKTEYEVKMKELKDEINDKIREFKVPYNEKIEAEKNEIDIKVREYKNELEREIKGYIEACDFPITRQVMDVPIPHSDGCGWVLPSVSKKNFMCRLPWIKGLLASCDFIKFCKEERKKFVNGEWIEDKGNYKVTDIYGKEHDLLEEETSVIFSESQFKAWKYYQSWEQYKEYFKQYDCKANICKVERDTKDIKSAKLNYQMFQTLTDMTDEEINHFIAPINEHIVNGYTNLETMKDLLGVNKEKRTNLQTAIRVYPELVQETYCVDELREGLASYKNKAKYAKFEINAKYSFIIPDLYSWMEFTFNKNPNPKGLLEDGQVSCKLFSNKEGLVVNRSPQLYKELPCRENTINSNTKKWLNTNAIYISCHDLITKTIQCDSDGDESVIVADPVYYKAAERNMKDIRPLYYKMAKSSPEIITNENLYNALIRGYKYSNIGQYSNKITIMWNEENIDLNTIKILTCLNNFFIDASKSGYFPTVSKEIKEKMKQANGKLPYFFQFAKDKDKEDVKELNNSTVNRICNNIESRNTFKYDFSKIGKFNYETLLINKKIDVESDGALELIKCYKELDKMKTKVFADTKLDKHEIWYATFSHIKKEMNKKAEELGISYLNMVDIIVKDIFLNNKDNSKLTMWETFGTSIIETMRINIKKPTENGEFIICEDCGKHVKNEKNKKFCPVCSDKRIKERDRNRKKK